MTIYRIKYAIQQDGYTSVHQTGVKLENLIDLVRAANLIEELEQIPLSKIEIVSIEKVK